MATIRAEGVEIYFNPYTDTPESHFERVTRDISNAVNENISYEELVEMAEDRSVSAVRKKDLKQAKSDVEEDINRIFGVRGTSTLEDFLSVAEELELSVDWEDSKESAKSQYDFPAEPDEPEMEEIPREPSQEHHRYQPDLSVLDYIIPSWKREKKEEAREKYRREHAEWEEEKERIETENEKRRERYENRIVKWEAEVEEIKKKRREAVEEVEQLRENYRSGEKGAVEQVINGILENSPYPTPVAFDRIKEAFEGDIETTFKSDSRLLIVDRAVPPPEAIPKRKKIKYVKSRDAFKGKDLSKRDFNQLYETIPYQLALRTAYEVFSIDEKEGSVIDSVVVNGWVTSVNPATGHEETVCTLSLQASREEIMSLNLSQVNPKAAFKNLKGVSASKLRDKSPVTPIIQADRGDSRFTEGRDVGEEMDEGENIAAMDWEDFEHLIRELFESEFAEEGGEVNVTQASRDGGIDAVAFDPDPLRGGKIVIQAKRYTQTVGVSAVRDLYGTVMNEGASRGILVTTSDYGSAAYDFAKDKPLQLLDGGNLLGLLEQHGYDARIDVEEAREKMD